jgi:hypothetical protein
MSTDLTTPRFERTSSAVGREIGQSNLPNICRSFARVSALGRRFPIRVLFRFEGSIPAWAASFRRPILFFWMACLALERISAVSCFSFSRSLIAA